MSLASSKQYKHRNLPVAVVGAGAGGLPAAVALAERGIDVVLFEKGNELEKDKIPTNRFDYELTQPWQEGEKHPWSGTVSINNGIGLGGSTVYFQAVSTCLPLQTFEKWGITVKSIEHIINDVTSFLQITGKVQPHHDLNPVSKHLLNCARGLGWEAGPAPVAILSRPAQGRASCVRCGLCVYGCRVGDKSSADNTWLPRARKTNKVDIRKNTTVEFIELADDRTVKSLHVVSDKGKYQLPVSAVILSAGVLETPYLLKKSKQRYAPDGIGNRNVGRYLTGTLWQSLLCSVPGKKKGHSGIPVDLLVEEFRERGIVLAQSRNYAGIYGPLSAARFCHRYVTRMGLRKWMRGNYESLAGLAGFSESSTTFDDGIVDLETRRYQKSLTSHDLNRLQELNSLLSKWANASQADVLFHLNGMTYAGEMFRGTCRMGVDPEVTSVDTLGRLHGYDNLLVSDASLIGPGLITDPSLTIQILGFYIGDEYGKRVNRQ